MYYFPGVVYQSLYSNYSLRIQTALHCGQIYLFLHMEVQSQENP